MTWVEEGLEKDKAGGLNGSKGDKNGIISRVHCVWFLALTFPQCSVSWPLLRVVSRACSAAPDCPPDSLNFYTFSNELILTLSQSPSLETGNTSNTAAGVMARSLVFDVTLDTCRGQPGRL